MKAQRVNDKFGQTPGKIFLVEKMIANGCQLLLYEKDFSKACLLCGVLSCLAHLLCRLSGECLPGD